MLREEMHRQPLERACHEGMSIHPLREVVAGSKENLLIYHDILLYDFMTFSGYFAHGAVTSLALGRFGVIQLARISTVSIDWLRARARQ